MTLIATPGDADADSYCTLDEATAYFTARNVTTWAGEYSAKEAAARVGTSYLDNQYRFLGIRASADQALAWPPFENRNGWPLCDADGYEIAVDAIPAKVKAAPVTPTAMRKDRIVRPRS